MRILSIETSCDDTGIAVIDVKNGKFNVLANELSSQVKLHAPYGGVYPSLAKREHQKNLPLVLEKTLWHAKVEPLRIDCIAVTVGPGLDPCLWAGIEFAKKLAKQWDVPIIPVNHLEGHMLISLLMPSDKNPKSKTNTKYKILNTRYKFPAIALIVSGGHTELALVKKIGSYKIIGETRDDAAGECLDKTARILGLPYPGGPAIAAQANLRNLVSKLKETKFLIKLPRPMIHTKNYDFSFSGLKTAVLYDFQSRTAKVQKSKEYISAMAKEIQQAVIDVLIAKTMRAVQEYNAKSIVLGGGVAANEELRKQFICKLETINPGRAGYKLNFLVAAKNLCTDNGLMIALAGYFHKPKTRIGAEPNLRLK